MHALTLDEQALYETEEIELERMGLCGRMVYKAFVSPLRRAFRKGKKSWPVYLNEVFYAAAAAFCLGCAAYVFLFSVQLNRCSQCEQDEVEETCVAAKDGECSCPDTLYDYCGGGNANGASIAWLEMALCSVVPRLYSCSGAEGRDWSEGQLCRWLSARVCNGCIHTRPTQLEHPLPYKMPSEKREAAWRDFPDLRVQYQTMNLE